jgi:hypothetical protein
MPKQCMGFFIALFVMKKMHYTVCLISILAFACMVKKAPTSNTNSVETTINNVDITDKTLGKVSHKYRAAGCKTVIEVRREGEELQTLIPKDVLPASLDVDGKEIYFNYRVLRMPQPAGCTVGQPAEINDAVKK